MIDLLIHELYTLNSLAASFLGAVIVIFLYFYLKIIKALLDKLYEMIARGLSDKVKMQILESFLEVENDKIAEKIIEKYITKSNLSNIDSANKDTHKTNKIVPIAEISDRDNEKLKAYFKACDAGEYKKAFEILKPIAESGDAVAEFYLGVSYTLGSGIEQSNEKAVAWYRKAAEHGHGGAQFNIAGAYAKGHVVEKDDKKAFQWCEKSAEQGIAMAQFNLGVFYESGDVIEKDYAEAVKWYRKAADQGYARAQNNLGNQYFYGRGVIQDYISAYAWLSLCKAQGYETAAENLDKLVKYMTPETIAQAQAKAQELEAEINKI